ncbi:MAG TPA: hypothetical protein VL978_00670 [Puia sp.]|nr:hypothetical protein [Puia sp.]
MSAFSKGYPSAILRSSLLIGYLFFLAAQSNHQYFDTANFFIYGHDDATRANSTVSRNTAAASVETEQGPASQHSLTQQVNQRRIGHLGIDKRFQFQKGLRIPPVRAPGVLFCTITRTRFYTDTPAYLSANPPVNALRGPPFAA